MAGFRRSSMIIAKAGIYDLRLHHDDVIMPILRHWDVFGRSTSAASASRPATSSRPASRVWTPRRPAFVERRAEHRARAVARSGSDETPEIAS